MILFRGLAFSSLVEHYCVNVDNYYLFLFLKLRSAQSSVLIQLPVNSLDGVDQLNEVMRVVLYEPTEVQVDSQVLHRTDR